MASRQPNRPQKTVSRGVPSPVEGTLAADAPELGIELVRGQWVMLDQDLARLYGVATGRLNEGVTRNLRRFPGDFMFRLTAEEAVSLKSRSAISQPRRGGRRRSTPRAFTQEGIAMLSSVLRSERAVAVNIEVMRAFVRLRHLHGEYRELARQIEDLERLSDERFRVVFRTLRQLIQPPAAARREIGFRPAPTGRSARYERPRLRRAHRR